MRNAGQAGTQTSVNAKNAVFFLIIEIVFARILDWVPACDAYGIVATATRE
jgi:hypothetical protein